MKLFLDTSVLLAACGSSRGASRELFHRATATHWSLLATPYVTREVSANLNKLPPDASDTWTHLRTSLRIFPDVLTLNLPSVFAPAKDRPILFSALAWADLLLTLDQADFQSLLGTSFYGLLIMKPGAFLQRERTAGRLP